MREWKYDEFSLRRQPTEDARKADGVEILLL